MRKKRFYAVRNGRKPGLYRSWEECSAQVDGYRNADYRSFPTQTSAEDYLNGLASRSRNVQKLKSRRLAVVIVEEATDSFAFPHASRRCADNFDGFEKAIIEALMVQFSMIMGYELSDRVSQHILTEENHLIETAFFDCSDEPLRVGIQIR